MSDLEYARRTGAWLVNNQVREVPGKNPAGMDVGRFPINISVPAGDIVDNFLSTNWFTGMSVYALQLLHDLDRDDKWLNAALGGGHYLRALQLTMDPDPAANGALYEYAPYQHMCCPRDALSGAWGLLRLHHATGGKEDLARAELFAHWHMTQALKDGYPVWSHNLGKGGNGELAGNFQAGSALFYADLYETTGTEKYLKTSTGISDFFMEHFWDEQQGICITYDHKDAYRGDYRKAGTTDWNEMHKFNDDFGALALMMNTALTGDTKYLEFACDYLDWVLENQNDDGSFGRLRLEVSSCVSALNLLNGWLATGDDDFLEGARRARTHLLANYCDTPDVPATDGGVTGLHHCVLPADGKKMVSLRVTMYTVYTMALFGIIESGGKGLREDVLLNPMFPGLRYDAEE